MTAPIESQREKWGSQAGFILSSVGSAIGVGNIWRFTYITGISGGGAFLIPYLLVTLLFGILFMAMEFAVGRYFQTSVISSLTAIGKKFKIIGILPVAVTFVILSYYLVIIGWIISFLFSTAMFPALTFEGFTDTYYPMLFFGIILGINYFIIRRGISKGIEKASKAGVIALIVILIPMTVLGMSLPGAQKGLEYYLTPDFGRLSDPSIWSTAFGQVFFSLALGQGILIAYGSYLREKTSLLKSSVIISGANASFSLIAGLMIFSFVFAFGLDPAGGTSLVFKVMPEAFHNMEFGTILGVVFFSLLTIAGITSSISMMQVPVAALEDSRKYSKQKAVLIVTIALFIAGSFSVLSYSPAKLSILGSPVLDFMDAFIGTYGVTTAAVLFVIVVSWYMNKKELLEQINANSSFKLPKSVIGVLRYVFPPLIILVMIANALGI